MLMMTHLLLFCHMFGATWNKLSSRLRTLESCLAHKVSIWCGTKSQLQSETP
ncbi:hypothetical protein CTAM01_10112 [Colletotrichum tamarilloi]|uniref:Uncharacterized protein n=1 Tax=Colletotrichum tamarilloi TaxID=1209934 RepID=A0ABQ9R1J5_9PEZI|nr:uncharacterized protein CTAM01_10112 [Colletotrichum tamarilloi]KAK1492055.1 hypothetical protein CTAM01_10112 [Colletotrichum tamarilloi]